MSIEKKSLVSLLIRLSKSDDQIHVNEARFIMDVGSQLGLGTDEITEIENNLDAYPLDPPKSEQERVRILYHLLFMMKMDGEISEEESLLIHQIGLKLGFRPEMVNAMIQLIKEHIHTDVPPDQMLSILRRYLN
ncbi:MAG: hypothetical protein AAF696_04670 [Bacteroidota bacterium]